MRSYGEENGKKITEQLIDNLQRASVAVAVLNVQLNQIQAATINTDCTLDVQSHLQLHAATNDR